MNVKSMMAMASVLLLLSGATVANAADSLSNNNQPMSGNPPVMSPADDMNATGSVTLPEQTDHDNMMEHNTDTTMPHDTATGDDDDY